MGQENVPNYPRFIDQYSDPNDKRNNNQLRMSFASVLASGWDPEVWEMIGPIGAGGQTVSQSSGNGLMTSGTTANAETIMRMKMFFSGSMSVRGQFTLSQRIANNNFIMELVDVIGDHLAFTVLSATQVQVTIPASGPSFSNANIGQSMTLGKVQGTAIIPGRYPIAAVDDTGKKLTFTVTSGPSSGSGTVCVFGWNFHRTLFDGTTVTNAKYDTGRKGWATNDTTTTITTTASPVVVAMSTEDGAAAQLTTTQNSNTWSQIGIRTQNIPDNDVDLVIQIRMLNGTTNPASNTTLTVGFVHIETADPIVARIGSQPGFTGSNQIALSPNATMEITRVNGGTIATNNGTASAQAIRVVIASDNTAFTVNLGTGGTGATSLGKARDGASGATDTVIGIAAIRRSIPTTVTPAAGDYEVPQLSDKGALWIAKQGAPSTSHTISAASTNATNSKGSAGILHDASCNNLNAAVRYLKIYDKATAPTVGTDTPKRVIAVPAGQSIQQTLDIECTLGIGWALTTGIANSDTGVVGANEHAVGLSWF